MAFMITDNPGTVNTISAADLAASTALATAIPASAFRTDRGIATARRPKERGPDHDGLRSAMRRPRRQARPWT